jgi:uncharacterized DUF497 family protein
VQIEFDTDKDAANIARHGVALALGAKISDDHEVLIVPTIRERDREERYKAIGLIGVDGRTRLSRRCGQVSVGTKE